MHATYNKKSELLKRELSKNLKEHQKFQGGVSISKISKVCYASASTIERWFKGTSLPDLPNLYMMADYFGCSIYNLIESKEDTSYYLTHQPVQSVTYADQVHFFLQLYSSPYTTFESLEQLSKIISHPIVRFLVASYYKNLALVRDCGVDGTELQAWVTQMSKDFAIPVSPASPRRIREVLNHGRTLDLYSDFLRTAQYLHDHEPEEQLKAAKKQEESNLKEWSNPDDRIPTPEEIRKYPDFYKTGDEFFKDVLKEDEEIRIQKEIDDLFPDISLPWENQESMEGK